MFYRLRAVFVYPSFAGFMKHSALSGPLFSWAPVIGLPSVAGVGMNADNKGLSAALATGLGPLFFCFTVSS